MKDKNIMSWNEIGILYKKQTAEFQRVFKRKSKFIVDENLGFSVTEILREFGWNVKDISEVGLSGESDENIFAYAYKHERIILTHDEDFLDDRNFPFYKNPGVIVFPGGQGDTEFLERAIADMFILIAPFYDVYRGAKIKFYADREVKIRFVTYDGYIQTSRYKFIGKKIFEWVE